MSINTEVFNAMIRRYESLKPEIVKKVAEAAIKYWMDQFDSQDNGNWAPKVNGEIPTLVDTGTLRSAIENCLKEDDFHNIVFKLEGTNPKSNKDVSEYYEYQQQAGRDFFSVSYEWQAAIEAAIEKELEKLK